jgi:hypothetical protein
LLASNRSSILAALILIAGLAVIAYFSGASRASHILAGIVSFDQQEIAELAPRQPYDAFFGECPSLVHRDGTTYFVYADIFYDVYAKAYDHEGQSLSGPSFIADGWNDHIRPAILIDDDGFFHVLYAARPMPLRYHRSENPLDQTSWSDHEQVGTSATYPVPFILGGKLYVIYREGSSYGASLSLAVRDLSYPMGSPSAWTVTTLVAESTLFVPMPLAAFESNGSVCFLFNMRDALLSAPYTTVAPSIREGMSVICTADGTSFTDLSGEYLEAPLDYTGNRGDFPEVTRHDEYVRVPLDQGIGAYDAGDLRYDGAFVELTITPTSLGQTTILVGDSAGCSCLVEFTASGEILLSDGDSRVAVLDYEPGTEYALRLKFHFSAGSYRPWINGTLAGDPMLFTFFETVPDDELCIDSVTIISEGDCSIDLVSGREHKLITASACLDRGGMANIFFIDRMDSSERSRWRLMHQRGERVDEIGDPLYHKYHPSSIAIGDSIYVAASYFEGEGLFLSNEHLSLDSRIVLIGSCDLESWGETELAAGSGGHVHPIFKRADESGPLELIWARMESGASTSLMHGYTGSPDTLFPEPEFELALTGVPNPFTYASAVRLVLDRDYTVSVEIYDCAGRCVRRLLDRRPMTEGENDITWYGYDDNGRKVVPGIYFVRARSNAFDRSIKIVLIR